MTHETEIDWLTEQRPQVGGPSRSSTDLARAALIAHGAQRRRRRRVGAAAGTATVAGVAVAVAVAVAAGGGTGHLAPRGGPRSVAAAPRPATPTPRPTPLVRLASDVRRLHRLPGDATLVVRHTVTHEADVGTFTAFDLYADDGHYYFGDSTADLREQVAAHAVQYNQSSPRVLRAFARAAADSPAQARRVVVATQPRSAVTPQPRRPLTPGAARLAARNLAAYKRTHHGHRPPRWTFRAYLDSYLWIVATQALEAGAGRPQVRAGAMQVLASLQHTTQTSRRLDGRPVLRVRFDNLGSPETVWLTDGTGVPLREVDGSGPDASVTTYRVRRVSLTHLP